MPGSFAVFPSVLVVQLFSCNGQKVLTAEVAEKTAKVAEKNSAWEKKKD